MREGKSSLTAAYVAFLRALGDLGLTSARGFSDAPARSLLSQRGSVAAAWLALALEHLPASVRERVVAHVDLLACRSLAIDAALARAVEAGCTQVVVLGAGFDDRAHRMKELASVRLFEVDHPATQATKRARAAELPRVCRELAYVPCDFERDALAERLAGAGHRADERTAWVWEGVTLYLRDKAIQDTLAALAACSAKGSFLIVEYHEPRSPRRRSAYAAARVALLALCSERQLGARRRQVMHRELDRAGLRLDADFAVSEWGASFAGAKPPRHPPTARLAIVTRA